MPRLIRVMNLNVCHYMQWSFQIFDTCLKIHFKLHINYILNVIFGVLRSIVSQRWNISHVKKFGLWWRTRLFVTKSRTSHRISLSGSFLPSDLTVNSSNIDFTSLVNIYPFNDLNYGLKYREREFQENICLTSVTRAKPKEKMEFPT